MSNSTVISDLQALEQLLKVDLVQSAGTPLVTFLQQLATIDETLTQSAQPSPAQLAEAAAQAAAAFLVFKASIIGELPNLGAELTLALINFSMSKVQTYIATATAAAAAQASAEAHAASQPKTLEDRLTATQAA